MDIIHNDFITFKNCNMAQYKIVDPIIRVIGQQYDLNGNPVGGVNTNVQNAGKKYLRCTLKNTRCFWEEGQTYTCFLPEIIAAFESVLPINKGGQAQQEQPIPAELATIQGCWVDWKPAQMFYKKHLSDHPAQPATPTKAARPAIKAGDLVGEKGNPTIFTTLRIFCIYYIDEFNEKQFIRGNSPEEVGQRAFSNYCIPVTENKTPQVVTQPEPEVIGGQTIQPAAIPVTPQYQPQPQQPQQPQQFQFAPGAPIPPTM